MSLFAYADPLTSPNASLLDVSQRAVLATMVNNMLLRTCRVKDLPPPPLLLSFLLFCFLDVGVF